jgi:hypothetical protein
MFHKVRGDRAERPYNDGGRSSASAASCRRRPDHPRRRRRRRNEATVQDDSVARMSAPGVRFAYQIRDGMSAWVVQANRSAAIGRQLPPTRRAPESARDAIGRIVRSFGR